MWMFGVLSTELVMKIFSFVDSKTMLTTIPLICRDWNKLAYELLWPDIIRRRKWKQREKLSCEELLRERFELAKSRQSVNRSETNCFVTQIIICKRESAITEDMMKKLAIDSKLFSGWYKFECGTLFNIIAPERMQYSWVYSCYRTEEDAVPHDVTKIDLYSVARRFCVPMLRFHCHPL